MIRPLQYAGCFALLALTTACHGDCYIVRNVDVTGRFGDTLVAVSGTVAEPGGVRLEMLEQVGGSPRVTSRWGTISINPTTGLDTVSLYRMTLASDPTRAAVLTGSLSPNSNPGTLPIQTSLSPDSVAFEKLFVHLATEDVLFELVGKNGAVVKALLNLENRQGPREACERWT